MRRLLCLAPFVLAACADPMIPDSDVIQRGRDPAYSYGDGGGVLPSSCRGGASDYSAMPSGCQRDLVFAAQVVNPSDMVQPTPPGAASAGPIGRAADRYLQPESRISPVPPLTDGNQRSQPRLIHPQQGMGAPIDPYGGMMMQ